MSYFDTMTDAELYSWLGENDPGGAWSTSDPNFADLDRADLVRNVKEIAGYEPCSCCGHLVAERTQRVDIPMQNGSVAMVCDDCDGAGGLPSEQISAILDKRNCGLNADWCVSAWQMTPGDLCTDGAVFLLDNEDSTLSLVIRFFGGGFDEGGGINPGHIIHLATEPCTPDGLQDLRNVVALAWSFRQSMQNFVPMRDLRRIDAANASEVGGPLSDTCHSHDYIDANMVMCSAFEAQLQREHDASSQIDADLQNRAWQLAKLQGFSDFDDAAVREALYSLFKYDVRDPHCDLAEDVNITDTFTFRMAASAEPTGGLTYAEAVAHEWFCANTQHEPVESPEDIVACGACDGDWPRRRLELGTAFGIEMMICPWCDGREEHPDRIKNRKAFLAAAQHVAEGLGVLATLWDDCFEPDEFDHYPFGKDITDQWDHVTAWVVEVDAKTHPPLVDGFNVGDRVRFAKLHDPGMNAGGEAIIPAGEFGTVVENSADMLRVQLDLYKPIYKEWDNCVQWTHDDAREGWLPNDGTLKVITD
jgi:hypothetical protein